MKYLLQQDGLYLMTYTDSGIIERRIGRTGQSMPALTGLWGDDIKNAHVFYTRQAALKYQDIFPGSVILVIDQKGGIRCENT